MFALSSHEIQARESFARSLKVYLHAVDTQFYRVHLKKGGKVSTPGVAMRAPEPDAMHVFNNGGMLAVSHTIEDLAAESKSKEGELIVTFQDLKNFLPRRKRYIEMAQELESIRIWGQGTPPKRCPGIDFVPVFHPEVIRYWVVLFAGPTANAILVAKQINKAEDMAKKYFLGFYSLNPFVVHSMRRSFALLNSGLEGAVQMWEQRCKFPEMTPQILRQFLPPTYEREKHPKKAPPRHRRRSMHSSSSSSSSSHR